MPHRVRLGAASAQLRCNQWPEMVDPAAHGLIGEYDPAFRQHIFDVAKAQGEPQIEPDRLLDDFGGKPVPFVADFLHPLGYRTASEAASKICRDKAQAGHTVLSIRVELRAKGLPARRG